MAHRSSRCSLLCLLSVVCVVLQACEWWKGNTLTSVPGIQPKGKVTKPAPRKSPAKQKRAPQIRETQEEASSRRTFEEAEDVDFAPPQDGGVNRGYHGASPGLEARPEPTFGKGEDEEEVGPHTRMQGGRYQGMTFEELRIREPQYCEWVAKSPYPRSWMVPLQRYLRGSPGPVSADAVSLYSTGLEDLGPDTIVEGGCHKGKTFEEVAQGEPDYSRWVVSTPSTKLPGWARQLQQYLDGGLDVQRAPSPEPNRAGKVLQRTTARSVTPEELDGDMTVGGGKYRHLTLQDLVQTQPQYCTFLKQQKHNPQAASWIPRVIAYLESQELPTY